MRRQERIGFTVDLLGEAVVSEQEANEYAARCYELVDGLAAQTSGWSDPLGGKSELFPVVNVSVKISALYSQMNPADPEDAIAHLIRLQPSRIVYISCDVATLARDMRSLHDAGYGLADLGGIDLFPNTAHVESVAVLTR